METYKKQALKIPNMSVKIHMVWCKTRAIGYPNSKDDALFFFIYIYVYVYLPFLRMGNNWAFTGKRQTWQPTPKLTSVASADFNLIYKFPQHVCHLWSPSNLFRQFDGFRDHRRYHLAGACVVASALMFGVAFVVSMAFLLLYYQRLWDPVCATLCVLPNGYVL